MKYLVTTVLFICNAVTVLHAQQWLSVGPDDHDWPSLGQTQSSCLVLDAEGDPVVLYKDVSYGSKATVRRWNGLTWNTVGTLGISAGEILNPSLVLDAGGDPVIAYTDYDNGSKATVMRWNGLAWNAVGIPGFTSGEALNIYVGLDGNDNPVIGFNTPGEGAKVMLWNGSTWSEVGGVGNSIGVADNAVFAFDASGYPVVAYSDASNDYKVTVKRWDGASWGIVGNPGISDGDAWHKSLVLDASGKPVVAYSDWANDGPTVMRWDGSEWNSVGNPGFYSADPLYLSLALDADGDPLLAFDNGFYAEERTTVMRWNGQSWSAVGNPAFSRAWTSYQSLAIDPSGSPVVAYSEDDNFGKVVVMRLDGMVWDAVGTPGVSLGVDNCQSLVLDHLGNPVVAYLENYRKIKVMRWSGSAWNPVGDSIPELTSFASFGGLSLALDSTDAPIVAYCDAAHGNKITVVRLVGEAWTALGTPDISAGAAPNPCLVLDASGDPVVAYSDGANEYKATVMRWNGLAWSTVGGSGFTDGPSYELSLAIDSTDNPVLAYFDLYGNGTTVTRWDGLAWSAIGGADFALSTMSPSLALDPTGHPVVGLIDESSGIYKATVMRWDGLSWSAVGAPGFSDGEASNIGLALDSAGEPVVAYLDATRGNMATVRRWNGSSWETMGPPGFSADIRDYFSSSWLRLDAQGDPVVAYSSGYLYAKWFHLGLEDCLGVPNGTTMPGTPCDDGDNCTQNDAWSIGCECAGTAIVVSASPIDTLCRNIITGTGTGTFDLAGSATPTGGTWSGTGVEVNVFNPAAVPAGTYTLTYSVDVNACHLTASREVTSLLPTVTTTSGTGLPDDCSTTSLHLEAQPAGGAWHAPAESTGMVYRACSYRPFTLDSTVYTLLAANGQCYAHFADGMPQHMEYHACIGPTEIGPDTTVCFSADTIEWTGSGSTILSDSSGVYFGGCDGTYTEENAGTMTYHGYFVPAVHPSGQYTISKTAWNTSYCGTSVASLTVTVVDTATPTVSLEAVPGVEICEGTNVTFTAGAYTAGLGTVSYDFIKNGTSVQDGPSNTWLAASLADGDEVSCSITVLNAPCLTSPTADSDPLLMQVASPTTWYADQDGDGLGDPLTTQLACAQPQGYVAAGGDECPNDPMKTAPGICGCGVPDADTDGDTIADCADDCPDLAGQIGDPCDDGDTLTVNEVITGSCVCQGSSPDGITEMDGSSSSTMTLFPNPSHTRLVRLHIEGLSAGIDVLVVIRDGTGKRVYQETTHAEQGVLDHPMDLSTRVSQGVYTVEAIAGKRHYLRSLVVQ
jgi:hypothetical protein